MLYTEKKVKKSSKILTVVLSLLVLILAVTAVFSWLALNGSGDAWKKRAAKPSSALGESLIKSALTGKEQSFSADETDGYLNYILQKHRSGIFAKTNYVALRLAGGNTADIYIPVQYKGRMLGITIKFIPSCDTSKNCLIFKVKSFYIGRLPIKPSWALKMVKNKMPSGFTAQNDIIYYDIPQIRATVGVVSAKAQISELKAESSVFKIRVITSVGLSVSNG